MKLKRYFDIRIGFLFLLLMSLQSFASLFRDIGQYGWRLGEGEFSYVVLSDYISQHTEFDLLDVKNQELRIDNYVEYGQSNNWAWGIKVPYVIFKHEKVSTEPRLKKDGPVMPQVYTSYRILRDYPDWCDWDLGIGLTYSLKSAEREYNSDQEEVGGNLEEGGDVLEASSVVTKKLERWIWRYLLQLSYYGKKEVKKVFPTTTVGATNDSRWSFATGGEVQYLWREDLFVSGGIYLSYSSRDVEREATGGTSTVDSMTAQGISLGLRYLISDCSALGLGVRKYFVDKFEINESSGKRLVALDTSFESVFLEYAFYH